MAVAQLRVTRRVSTGGSGFTLVELLVALAILAALVALVPTAGFQLKAAMDYRDAVGASYRMLHQARSLAIRQGDAVVVSVDLDQRHMHIVGRPDFVSFPPELRLDLTVAGEITGEGIARFRFYPDGSATGGEMTLQRPGGRQSTLRLDWLTGRVRVEQRHEGA